MTFTSKWDMNAFAQRGWRWGIPAFALLAMALLLLFSANVPLFLIMNRGMSGLGDAFWSDLTVLGDAALALMFILPFVGRRPDLVWQFVLASIIASLWSHGMKELFSTLRPPAVLEAGSFHLIGQGLRNVSFPSGHTTTAFTLAGLFCLQVVPHGAARYGLLLLAFLVGLSRIACGVHWPMDVLGGMLIGWLSAVGGIWLGARWKRVGGNIWLQRALGALGVVLAVWVMADYDNSYAGTRWLQISVSASCLALSLPGLIRLSGIRAKGR
jgi:membrane-associated phospholipid phosphatase